jgi:hypothetical protein
MLHDRIVEVFHHPQPRISAQLPALAPASRCSSDHSGDTSLRLGVQTVSSAFVRNELEDFTFIHRCAFHKIDAVDNARSCDPLDSGQRFRGSSVLRGEQVTFFEFHLVLLRHHPAHH